MGSYATVLFVLGLADHLADIADPKNDTIGLQLEEEHLPQTYPPPSPTETACGCVMGREVLIYVDLDGVPHLTWRLWTRLRKKQGEP